MSSTGTSSSGGTGTVGGKRGLGKGLAKGMFKGKGPASMARQEEDVRARMGQASETFRKAVLESQALRQEYFNFQQPKILRVSFRTQRLRLKLTASCSKSVRTS